MVFILTGQIEIYLCLLCFIIIHELTHMIVGILLGLRPKVLQIMPFGISIMFETYELEKANLKKLIIASSGPIINIILAILIFCINRKCETAIYTNIIIAVFNLLPIYPLDGGRIIKLFLGMKYKNQELEEISMKISNITIITITALASIVVLLWQNIALVFIMVYLWMIMIKENKEHEINKKIHNMIEKEKKKLYTNNK